MPHQSVTSATTVDRAGVFAPGHLGELTQIITPALVDQVLEATGRTQRRIRVLPSRVMVYFVLAMALLHWQGYRGIWAALTHNLPVPTPDPSTSALSQARHRLGSAPLKALFDTVKGCLASQETHGAWWRGLRLVAWDGTHLEAADSTANATFFGRHKARRGHSGFPSLRLSALIECGTRTLIDVTYGPSRQDTEQAQVTRLCSSLRPGMLLLADRGCTGHALVEQAAATRAHLLWRVATNRFLPVLQPLPDGSYLSLICGPAARSRLRTWMTRGRPGQPPAEGVLVRVIEAMVTVTTPEKVMTRSPLRLITTLLDPDRYPVTELATLYHQRWQAETTYYGLKVTMRDHGRVLRSTRPEGIVQELYGLLVVYQTARILAARAATQTGLDPDRISLTVTLRAAWHTLISAVGRAGRIGRNGVPARIRRAILNPRDLNPPRQSRILPRRLKRATSPYAYNKTRNNKPLPHIMISYSITPCQPPAPNP